MILYVLYLSRAAQHFLEGHIWVVCKNLKKMFAPSFAENIYHLRENTNCKKVNRPNF